LNCFSFHTRYLSLSLSLSLSLFLSFSVSLTHSLFPLDFGRTCERALYARASSIPRTMYDSFHGSLANRVCVRSFGRASSSVPGRTERESDRERENECKNYIFGVFWVFRVTSYSRELYLEGTSFKTHAASHQDFDQVIQLVLERIYQYIFFTSSRIYTCIHFRK